MPLAGPLFSQFAEATFDRPLLEFVQKLMFSPQPIDPGWKADFPWSEVLTPAAMVAEGEDSARSCRARPPVW